MNLSLLNSSSKKTLQKLFCGKSLSVRKEETAWIEPLMLVSFSFHLHNQHVHSHLRFAGEETEAPRGRLTRAASQCGPTFLRPDTDWAEASLAVFAEKDSGWAISRFCKPCQLFPPRRSYQQTLISMLSSDCVYFDSIQQLQCVVLLVTFSPSFALFLYSPHFYK